MIPPNRTATVMERPADVSKKVWRKFTLVIRGVLDEIFDQTAYRRHLAAHGAKHSGKEWRRFCDEHWAAKSRRGTCC